jgi:hypothetical protein
VTVLDLFTGEQIYEAQTKGWDTQLGAQAQWGTDDTQLFYNDMDTDSWKEYGVRANPLTGQVHKLEGTVYMVSPDGKEAVSPCLRRIGLTQAGYGVLLPKELIPANHGIPNDDGVYVTDTDTGRKTMLISYADVLKRSGAQDAFKEFGEGDFYGFHVKYNPQGTRIMLVLRMRCSNGKYIPSLFSMDRDGSHVYMTISPQEWGKKGGHHPNWYPDSEHILMNLKLTDNRMQIVKARYDGTEYGAMIPGILGTGHPSLHPEGRFLVTDCYLHEETAFGDGTVPIRLIRMSGEEEDIVRICTKPYFEGPKRELRVDPHPAWDRSFRYLVFNAFLGGTRQILIADMIKFL